MDIMAQVFALVNILFSASLCWLILKPETQNPPQGGFWGDDVAHLLPKETLMVGLAARWFYRIKAMVSRGIIGASRLHRTG
jgi:uncharacterized membrane protein YkgB